MVKEIEREVAILRFSEALTKAQAMAIKAEQDLKRKQKWGPYKKNSVHTKHHHAQNWRKLAETGHTFINQYFAKKTKEITPPVPSWASSNINNNIEGNLNKESEEDLDDDVAESLECLFPATISSTCSWKPQNLQCWKESNCSQAPSPSQVKAQVHLQVLIRLRNHQIPVRFKKDWHNSRWKSCLSSCRIETAPMTIALRNWLMSSSIVSLWRISQGYNAPEQNMLWKQKINCLMSSSGAGLLPWLGHCVTSHTRNSKELHRKQNIGPPQIFWLIYHCFIFYIISFDLLI